MVTAQIAWDLQAFSGGRFILGLGTQVKAHIERRFGMTWDPPVPKLRDYIQALRAIWQAFQTGGKLDYRGQFYNHTLMSPFFNPGPIADPYIPIYIAGVNEGLARLAGRCATGSTSIRSTASSISTRSSDRRWRLARRRQDAIRRR